MFKRFLTLFLATCFAWFSTISAHAADTIKIGSFLALSGNASILGDPELKTLQMYIDEINAAGGVNGKKLELIYYDSAGKTKEANDFVKKLIKKDDVDIILGGTTSGETLAVIDVVEQEQVPFISFAGAIEIVEPVKKWVFKTPHSDKMAVAKIYEDMKKRGISKVALITGNSGFDKSGLKQLHALASQYGITIVADETYDNNDTDMTTQLTKIRGTDAQAIINFGLGKAPAIVAKNIKQLGIKLPLYESHGVATKEFLTLAGDAAEGIRLPAAALLVADKLPDSDPQKKVVTAYKTKYEAKYGPVSTFGGHAYDGLFIAVEAMKRAKGTDKAKVRDEIEKTKGFIGTAGIFNMSPTDHMGLDISAFKMLEIKNGNWEIVN
ncbi:MAG: ABC transporter substrate-binding protein [Dissulfuribacterales bacterium]